MNKFTYKDIGDIISALQTDEDGNWNFPLLKKLQTILEDKKPIPVKGQLCQVWNGKGGMALRVFAGQDNFFSEKEMMTTLENWKHYETLPVIFQINNNEYAELKIKE